ncbi:MAG: hypothetical protein WCV88_00585 [Patescibacteria group bacterium]
MKNITKKILTPLGVQENGETLSLKREEHVGILHLLGRSGCGKSVTLESIIISDIYNGRGGMFIEPYGDLVKDIQSYIPADKINKVAVFAAQPGTLDDNIKKFHQEIDFTEMKNDEQKFLLCKIDYRTLGQAVARELGIYLVKQYWQVVGGKNRTLALDEAHNYETIVEEIIQNQEKGSLCILSDQTSMHYRTDVFERLVETANHILCYFIDTETANLINKYHSDMDPKELVTQDKYKFTAKINAKTAAPAIIKLTGIFPIPYPKK